uniref:Inositol oxygenase n=1 Tax=Angiostrongylus cantonensis TaxID=6313 RepID=A0A158PA70_ANGCA
MDVTSQPVFQQNGRLYRNYEENPENKIEARVKNHYYLQHQRQTVQFVDEMHHKWLGFNHGRMTIMGALDMLSNFLDESDPDVDVANLDHAYQTAERLRKSHPHKPWMHLAGLVHDLGKLMSVKGQEQWAVTGDTYPVGCAPSEEIVFGINSFEGNPDILNPKYNTKLGMYQVGCGLESLKMCWGHDEYMYQVLVNHGSTLPEEALYAIRFHSFYPYHSHNAYRQFINDKDRKMFGAILMLNECDLYSKDDTKPDIRKLKPYYQSLIDQYIPGEVAW